MSPRAAIVPGTEATSRPVASSALDSQDPMSPTAIRTAGTGLLAEASLDAVSAARRESSDAAGHKVFRIILTCVSLPVAAVLVTIARVN
jgi:hypothetical protein